MQELTLTQSTDKLSSEITLLEEAHKRANTTTSDKEAYFNLLKSVFLKSDHTLGMMLGLMGYNSKTSKNVYEQGLDIGVLNSTRNWMTLMNMRDTLQEVDSSQATEFFMKDFSRVVRPTFRELESKAKDYIFFQKNKHK